MATATALRESAIPPSTPTPAPAAGPSAGERAISVLAIGAAGIATVGITTWAAWVASQISIPI